MARSAAGEELTRVKEMAESAERISVLIRRNDALLLSTDPLSTLSPPRGASHFFYSQSLVFNTSTKATRMRREVEEADGALDRKEEKGQCSDPALRVHFAGKQCETCWIRTTVYVCGGKCGCLHHCYTCATDDGWSMSDLFGAK